MPDAPLSSYPGRIAGATLEELDALDAELAHRLEPAARTYRFQVAHRRMLLKKGVGDAPATRPAAAASARPLRVEKGPRALGGLGPILTELGFREPDGRPVHQYRLQPAHVDECRRLLRLQARAGFADAPTWVSALFVAWAAHWFQRGYRGGMRRWEDVEEALGAPLSGNDGRLLTSEGLAFWGRPVVRGEDTRQWLQTLAVEGGFPVGVLDEPGGWIERFLSRVVGVLLGSGASDPGAAFAAAQSQGEYVPVAYRQDIFFALAADLAAAVVALRKEAEENPASRGMPASAWLDAVRPAWRDTLPIPAGVEAASRLVDGLMRAEALRLVGTGGVGCDRVLLKREGQWVPGLRLGVDGSVPGALAREFSGRTGRMRVYPAGRLARHATGEWALLEPPEEVGAPWRMRPSRRSDIVAGVPLDVPVDVELREDGRQVCTVSLPGGEAVRGDFLVFESQAPFSDAAELTLIGRGSGGYRPAEVVIRAPSDWQVVPQNPDSRVERVGEDMWVASGRAAARAPDGEAFAVATGQAGNSRDRLRVSGDRPRGFEVAPPGPDIFAGPPELVLEEGGRSRRPTARELRWRQAGERSWQPYTNELAFGEVELAWRDVETGFTRDRVKLFLLPAGASLDVVRERGGAAYRPSSLSVSALKPVVDGADTEVRADSIWLGFRRRPLRVVEFDLSIGAGQPLRIASHFPLGTGIARWTGELMTVSDSLSLSSLADCVAFSEGPQVLHARLQDRNQQRVAGGDIWWTFRDELPLRGVAEELEALLAPCGDIDVSIELTVGGGSGLWRLRQFGAALEVKGRSAIPGAGAGFDTLELCARAMAEPTIERALGTSTAEQRLRREAIDLPPDLAGAWLFYLRRDDAVVSRPIVGVFPGRGHSEPTGQLREAIMVPATADREADILSALQAIGRGEAGSDAEVRWLIELAGGLRGLPAASFDALRLLPATPSVLARLAFKATADAREAVLKLADQLPFGWSMIPVEAWRRAAELELKAATLALRAEFGDEVAAQIGRAKLTSAAEALLAQRPTLCWPLVLAGLLPPQRARERRSLIDAASDHIRRYGDKTAGQNVGESFRETLGDLLPRDFERFDQSYHEALFAPCAAAAAAAGRIRLSADAARKVRSAQRLDSTYFIEAYDARLVTLLTES